MTKSNNITTPPRSRNHPDATPFREQQWWDKKSSHKDNAAADVLAVLMGVCRAHPERVRNGELEMTDILLGHFASASSGTVPNTLAHLVSLGLIRIRPSPDCKFRLNQSDGAYWIGLKPGIADTLNSTNLEVRANTTSKNEHHDEAPAADVVCNPQAVPQSQSLNPTPK